MSRSKFQPLTAKIVQATIIDDEIPHPIEDAHDHAEKLGFKSTFLKHVSVIHRALKNLLNSFTHREKPVFYSDSESDSDSDDEKESISANISSTTEKLKENNNISVLPARFSVISHASDIEE